MIAIDAARTRTLLPFEGLVPALRRMFAAGCEVPQRHTHVIAGQHGAAGTMLIMPAWQADAYLGVKTICIFPGNAEAGLPGLHSTYVLYDARTGVPLAHIDGNELTARRTAAAAALAASYLAAPQAQALTIIGAGRVASVLAQAYRLVRPIRRVRIWNRNPERARALAAANIDILLGTLLRPLHRKTRLAAFEALANAALHNGAIAQRIHSRAREALKLPDKRYPKPELIGLIARTLSANPNLASAAERPRIYRHAGAAA